jgi:hypothetical protein
MNNLLKELRNYAQIYLIMNKIFRILRRISVLLISLSIFSCNNPDKVDLLRQGFINPPDSARPGVYWYFMDGNLDREAMTADLESMKEAGIGYVLFLEVNVGVPRGKIDFLSEEWQDLFSHGVRECERLGIRLILGSGPGWAGSGGPWVTPAQSMSHLVASETTVTGPDKFNSILPIPEPKTPFFGENSLTPTLKQLRDDWYEDVVVLAFPKPANPIKISGIEEKTLYYRAPFTSQPGVLPYIQAEAGYNELTGASIDQSKIIDLTEKLQKDGTLQWDVPEGEWTIMRFGKRNNGAVTRPAPEPGLGFEADKFDTASFGAHYDEYVGKLINKVKPVKQENGGGWTMIHIDSWEMGSQNWSPHFREEFTKRRGYDLLPYLPVYTGMAVNSPEISERFLWDIRQTSNELIMENHARYFKELGKKNGFRLSIEPYDMNPASDFDLGSVADVPMCEFWSLGFNSAFSCIEATSIAHVKGVPVVAAEAFTADYPEAWQKYPGNMKDQGDWAFCMGINRLVYHPFAHKAFFDQYLPGMTMGPYGVHWDRGQTWWPMAEAYHKYISRCQYILSQGKSVADILYLTPEGAPQVFLPPPSAMDGTDVMPDKKGYSFDGCSPLYLIKNASVKDGKIVFPGGASYNVMVLPQIQTMTPELTSKIGSLIKDGATVIGNPPSKSPSLVNYPECDEQVRSIAESIWGNGEVPEKLSMTKSGSGKIWWGERILKENSEKGTGIDSLNLFPDYRITADLLKNAGINEDFKSSGNIRYTHRSLENLDIYFISNKTEAMLADTCIFRDASPDAEVWNPVTGEITQIQCYPANNKTIAVPVKLDAHQSLFIMFYHGKNDIEKGKAETFQDKNTVMKLEGEWNVSFDTIWGGPENVVFDELHDWAESKDEGIKYYSGIAVYRKNFDLPENHDINEGTRYYLDLGRVKNMGKIKLNGKDLGVLWTAPWQVEITDILKNEDNNLEIEIANLWVNRLIGDESEPWDGVQDNKWPEWLLYGTERKSKRYTFTTNRYHKKGDPLKESGLIGPVTIKR